MSYNTSNGTLSGISALPYGGDGAAMLPYKPVGQTVVNGNTPIVPYKPIGQTAGCGCGGNCNHNNGLSGLSQDDMAKVALDHFQNLGLAKQLSIGGGMVSGDLNPLAEEIGIAGAKICKKGTIEELKDRWVAGKDWVYIGGISVLSMVILKLVLNAKNSKKR